MNLDVAQGSTRISGSPGLIATDNEELDEDDDDTTSTRSTVRAQSIARVHAPSATSTSSLPLLSTKVFVGGGWTRTRRSEPLSPRPRR